MEPLRVLIAGLVALLFISGFGALINLVQPEPIGEAISVLDSNEATKLFYFNGPKGTLASLKGQEIQYYHNNYF
jgi:hypothetical protein